MATRKSGILDKNGVPIIQQITISQNRRSSQRIDTWKAAMQSAESLTNPRRGKLYDLYDDILLDAHLQSVVNKRLNAIKTTPLIFLEDGKENEVITKLLKTENFKTFLGEILMSVFKGHTLGEITIAEPEKFNVELINRKNVVPEFGYVAMKEGDTSGVNYREEPFNKYFIEAGSNKDLGLLLSAAQYVIYKRGGFGDWSQFAELFGMPFRIGKYDGYDENARMQLNKALEEAGSASYIVIPEGSSIEIPQNYGNAGSNQTYKSLIDACNSELSKLILGNTLTTEAGDKGARSLGEVHQEGEDKLHDADRMLVLFVLNEKITPLLKLHGYPINELGEWSFEDAVTVNLKERIEIDMQLNEVIPIDPEYWYERYNVPMPKNLATRYKQFLEEKKQKALPPQQQQQQNNNKQKPNNNYRKPSKNNSKKTIFNSGILQNFKDRFSSLAR